MRSREHAFVGCCLLLPLPISHSLHFRYLCWDALVIRRDLRRTEKVCQRCIVLLQPVTSVSTYSCRTFMQYGLLNSRSPASCTESAKPDSCDLSLQARFRLHTMCTSVRVYS